MKKILYLLLILLSPNSFANCQEQKNYNSVWTINGNKLQISIEKKDKLPFKYYDFKIGGDETFIGFKFSDNRYISYNKMNTSEENIHYGLFIMGTSMNFPHIGEVNLKKIFVGENNNNISKSIMAGSYNQSYDFPLDEKYKKITSQYIKNIDVNNFITNYKEIIEHNKIYGKQKIIFYINLITEADISRCAFFQSPEIEYNFARRSLGSYLSIK